MEEDLVARLRAASAVAAIAGEVDPLGTGTARPAIDWEERHSEAASHFPAAVLSEAAAGRDYTHAGALALTHPLVQIDTWGFSYADAKLLQRAIIDELEQASTTGGTNFGISLLVSARRMGTVDLGGGVKIFGLSMDLEVWSEPAS